MNTDVCDPQDLGFRIYFYDQEDVINSLALLSHEVIHDARFTPGAGLRRVCQERFKFVEYFLCQARVELAELFLCPLGELVSEAHA